MSRAAGSGVGALLHDYRLYAGPRLWLAFALMLLGSVAEGFGLLMIVPLASVAMGGRSPLPDAFPGLNRQGPHALAIALALFVAAMSARAVLLYARDLLLTRLETGYEASLRLRAAATLAERGWGFASRLGQAGMQSLLLNDVPRASHAVSYLQQLATSAAMLVVQLGLAAILSPPLTAMALAILALGLILSVGWTRRGVKSGLALVQRSEESTGSGFRMHAVLKASLAQGTVAQFLREYGSSLEAGRQETVRFVADLASARSFGFLGSAVAAALLLFVGVHGLALPLPVLIAILVLFARMSGPAQALQQAVQNIAAYAPSFSAIERRLGKLVQPIGQVRQWGRPLEWNELALEQVVFEHARGLGIADATLRLRRGEWLGISGGSGAGKTTLVDMVAGLLTPERGNIAIDGDALAEDVLERWRAGLAYVGQEGSVFDDSVRGNLLAEGAAATEAELWSALDLAGLAERVRALPNGLDERVGDRGSALSGGERQRLGIARALLRRPSLLILDEATAALDADSEAALLERLKALEPRPAALIVAHRGSTLSHCDSLLRIQHGVVQRSSPATE
jgi:ABC-type multidrug transport system fused ATPase/permease subunit